MLGFIAAQAGSSSDSSDPFESISNFFDSGLWSAISILLRVFVVLLWLALIYWTYQDARRRIEAPGPIAACVALSVLIPFLGTVIYLIVRPPEYLDEARERELELLALEQRLGELGDAEGQQIVGRMLAREGVASDPQNLARAPAPAGVASVRGRARPRSAAHRARVPLRRLFDRVDRAARRGRRRRRHARAALARSETRAAEPTGEPGRTGPMAAPRPDPDTGDV